jgi:hypothetical protein
MINERTKLFVWIAAGIGAIALLILSSCALNFGRDGTANITDQKEYSGTNKVTDVKIGR